MQMNSSKKYFNIITYGCQMNVHESEKLAGILYESGYLPCSEMEKADIIIFNTCCIRDNAEKKAESKIGMVKKLKKLKPSLIVAVCGCMVQQKGKADELISKFPFIDIVLGTSNSKMLKSAIEKINSGLKRFIDIELDSSKIENLPALRSDRTNAWLNIMYGCDNFCTYCIVPYVRGRERSRNKQEILCELYGLLEKGYKEITLLGQNVNSYKSEDGEGFDGLLSEISKINGKFRLRFMTSHPKDFNENIIDIMADSPNICNHIHLPLQSGSDKVLKDMNRKYNMEKYLSIIDYARKIIPDIGITTDIMVGFPTETEEDFEQTLNAVKTIKFSSAFTFVYSPRRFTAASKMEQIDEQTKRKRIIELVALQNKITAENNKKLIGKDMEVLTEDFSRYEGMVCGRTDCGRMVNFEGNQQDIGKFMSIGIEKVKTGSMFGKRRG